MSHQVRKNLGIISHALAQLRRGLHPKHHGTIDSYVRFIDRLVTHIEHQDKQMARTAEAIGKLEGRIDTLTSALSDERHKSAALQKQLDDAGPRSLDDTDLQQLDLVEGQTFPDIGTIGVDVPPGDNTTGTPVTPVEGQQ